jgi:uncharacterized protein YkwD
MKYRLALLVLAMLILISCPYSGGAPTVLPGSPLPTAAVAAPSPDVSTVRPVVPTPATPAQLPTPTPSATSTPTPTATSTPVITGTAALETRLLAIINDIRNANNLPSYRLDAALSDAARAHSCDMAANSFIGHSSSDGRGVTERMPPAEPPWVWPSESVAAGSDDPQLIVDWWMDEPPEGWHRRNILDQEQQVIGVGYCFRDDDPTGNRHYWTIDITRPGP